METEDVQISIITITRPAMASRCSATPLLLSRDPRTRTMGKLGNGQEQDGETVATVFALWCLDNCITVPASYHGA